MSNAHDRRAPGTARMQFDAMVEIGGSLGPSFEAQAVNLSEEGMSLRTAYLPEVGQPVMCRFDAGHGLGVVAAGEVLWKEDMGDGGEFGIRFTNLDGSSTVALQHILGLAEDGHLAPLTDSGRKVRLHIEGLASPMRARIKDQITSGVTAYSELGFLQMGRPLELEDAASGNRRPALIDRVEVEVDNASRIPQLIVSLRYDDTDGRAAVASLSGVEIPVDEGNGQTPHDVGSGMESDMNQMEMSASAGHQHYAPPMRADRAEATGMGSDDVDMDEESNKLKSAFARNAAKVTPALLSWARRAKVTAALLAARARRGAATGDDVAIPMRRTTAPAPGGGLHAEGRKVVRGSVPDDHFEAEATAKRPLKITKKRAVIAGSIGIASLLVFFAIRTPASAPQLAAAPPPGTAATSTEAPGSVATAATMGSPVAPPMDPLAAAAAAMNNGGGRPTRTTPFTNGPVGSRPTIIKIKMDGAIEAIQGATQPTGFTIVTPNRKSMDSATSLADKDPRISGINVSNEATGAEFNVTFKDGVPNYLVRAHGDTLELVLAKSSAHGDKAEARSSTTKKKRKSNKKH